MVELCIHSLAERSLSQTPNNFKFQQLISFLLTSQSIATYNCYAYSRYFIHVSGHRLIASVSGMEIGYFPSLVQRQSCQLLVAILDFDRIRFLRRVQIMAIILYREHPATTRFATQEGDRILCLSHRQSEEGAVQSTGDSLNRCFRDQKGYHQLAIFRVQNRVL